MKKAITMSYAVHSYIYSCPRGTIFLKSLRSTASLNFQQETLTQPQLQQMKVSQNYVIILFLDCQRWLAALKLLLNQ